MNINVSCLLSSSPSLLVLSPQSTQIDPEELFTKLDRIGKGSFGEVRVIIHILY